MLKVVTVNEQLAVLPDPSVAVHVTVVTPTGKQEPDGGEQATMTPGQLSEAVASAKLTTTHGAFAVGVLAMMFAGQVMTGGCVSFTVTVKLHMLIPAELVAVQSTVVTPTGNVCGEVMTIEPILHSTVGVGHPPVTVVLNETD
jgi:hypothetical protein